MKINHIIIGISVLVALLAIYTYNNKGRYSYHQGSGGSVVFDKNKGDIYIITPSSKGYHKVELKERKEESSN